MRFDFYTRISARKTFSPRANSCTSKSKNFSDTSISEADKLTSRRGLWQSFATIIIASAAVCSLSLFLAFATLRGASAEPAKKPVSEPVRVLHFPDKYSCGALYAEKFNSFEEVQNKSRKYLGPARGNVSVPGDAQIALYASFRTATHFQDLDQLKVNDLYKVAVDRIDTEEPLILAPLARLTGLLELNFVNCNLCDAEVAKLAPLKNIVRLNLWWCALKGTSFNALLGMRNLGYLNVSLDPLEPAAFEAIGRMSKVTDLDASKSELTDAGLAQIAKITGLVRINLNNNSAITGKGLQCLRSCKKLRLLRVAKGNITVDDLLLLKGTNINSISVSGSKISRKDWAKLHAVFPHTIFQDEDHVDADTKYVLGPVH